MVLKKIIDMLGASQYISPDVLKKGLSKIDPKLGKFFHMSEREGHSTQSAISFLNQRFSEEDAEPEGSERPDETANRQAETQRRAGGRIAKGIAKTAASAAIGGLAGKGLGMLGGALWSSGQTGKPPESEPQQQEPQSQAPQTAFANFINQHPDLGKYLDKMIEMGYDPVSAAKEAKRQHKFKSTIEQIEEHVGQPFEALMKQLFAGSEKMQEQTKSSGSRGEQLAAMIQALRGKRNGR